MTDIIELRKSEVAFIEETFGGLDTAELTVPHDESGEYEIRLDIEGTVDLDDLLTKNDGDFQLNLSALQTGEVEIREQSSAETVQENPESELETDVNHTARSNMPPIPDDSSLETPTDNRHYQRLVNNPDSQPAKYRRVIRNEGKISRPKLDRWAKRQGFEPETGGSHNASLLVLERIGEIERHGRGDDQRIVWVGE